MISFESSLNLLIDNLTLFLQSYLVRLFQQVILKYEDGVMLLTALSVPSPI
jgi:hypothetical protein